MLTLTKTKKNKLPLYIILALILIAAGVIGFMVWNNSRPPATTQTPPQGNTEQPSVTPPATTPQPPSGETPQPTGSLVVLTENEEYKVSRYENSNKYVITLYAIVNSPAQYEAYKQQLREYKQKAINYLKGQSVDINKVEIIYDPSEAASL